MKHEPRALSLPAAICRLASLLTLLRVWQPTVAHAQAAPPSASPPAAAPAASSAPAGSSTEAEQAPAAPAAPAQPVAPGAPIGPPPPGTTSGPATQNAAPAHALESEAQPAGDTGTAADSPGDGDLAAALADLSASSAVPDIASTYPQLAFYGFADFTFSKHLTPFAFGSKYATFAVGNLNLYMDSALGRTWRSLVEVRYTYLPDGARVIAPGGISRTDTAVVDYTDFGRTAAWGGILIERAWLEHKVDELLTVRVGSWLTPYGIWNVDHGSPVIIGVHRPWIVGEGLIPGRQTGIELYGWRHVRDTQLGYHLTLSNGRGPIDAYEDFNHNKAIGGRLYLRNDSLLGVISAGVSGYYGKYTERREEGGVTEQGTFEIRQPLALEYDELSLGVDLKWEWEAFLLQSEAAMNEVAYTEGARPVDPAFNGGAPGFAPDSRRHGAYVLAAYRTTFLDVMPFLGGEYYHVGGYPGLYNSRAAFGGLNMRVLPTVVIKAQYTHAEFTDKRPGTPQDNVNLVDAQAAWSF